MGLAWSGGSRLHQCVKNPKLRAGCSVEKLTFPHSVKVRLGAIGFVNRAALNC